MSALTVLFSLAFSLLFDGWERLSWSFFTSLPSRRAEQAGIFPALIGTIYLTLLTAIFALPLGVSAAIYLEEYANKNVTTRLIELAIANLAAVPSIIFGLLGLQLFVRWLDLGRSLLAGSLTLTLLVLPVIILSSREAIRAVPQGIRDGAAALGASPWQTAFLQILPAAFPGILTGAILGLSRVVGETAPLITIGALTYVPFAPDGLFSAFTVLPIQAFNWISRPQSSFHQNAAGDILVLLGFLLLINSLAIYLRQRLQKRLAL